MGWKDWNWYLLGPIIFAFIFVLKTINNFISAKKWIFQMDLNYMIQYIHLGLLIVYILAGLVIGAAIKISINISKKDISYWKKGTFIFGIFGFLLFLYLPFQLASFSCQFSGGCSGDFIRLLTVFLKGEYFIGTFFLIFIPSLIGGALIGWIYGKIKSKK